MLQNFNNPMTYATKTMRKVRRDYAALGILAAQAGLTVPPFHKDWGWRKIKKINAQLIAALNENGYEVTSAADCLPGGRYHEQVQAVKNDWVLAYATATKQYTIVARSTMPKQDESLLG